MQKIKIRPGKISLRIKATAFRINAKIARSRARI